MFLHVDVHDVHDDDDDDVIVFVHKHLIIGRLSNLYNYLLHSTGPWQGKNALRCSHT